MNQLFKSWLQSRQVALVSLAVVAGLLGAVCLFRPGSAFLPPCPFFRLTGWYCPGCGSTRMLYWLAHGDLAAAFRQNPLALLLLPLIVLRLLWDLLPCRWQPRMRFSHHWILAVALFLVLYGVARNLPQYPFCTLAPGGCPTSGLRAVG